MRVTYPTCPHSGSAHILQLFWYMWMIFWQQGPRQVLQPLLTQLLHVWKGSNPDFLGREPGDVDTLSLSRP